MTDVNQEDTDDAYDPTQPQDYGDYNPESIDYEAQDDDSAEEEAYPGDNAANEPAQDPGFVEAAPQTVAQPSGYPIASRSATGYRSPPERSAGAQGSCARSRFIVASRFEAEDDG